MIKVKQFACIPPPYGGISVYVKRLYLYLNKLGFDTSAFYTKKLSNHSDNQFLKCHKFPLHTRSIWGILALPRLLYILSSHDLLHTHLSLNTSLLTYLLHKLLNIPVVYTIHNQMIDRECQLMNGIDRYFFNLLKNDKDVQFITVNTMASDMLNREFGQFRNPIIVQPAFLPPIEVGIVEDYISSDLHAFITSDSPVILFYAESFAKYLTEEIYGSNTAINVFVSLKEFIPNLKLVFCMPQPDISIIESYKNYLDDLGYSSDVFWQIQPLQEMWPLLKLCTLLFRPTCTDGDSIMIREALSYGLPVVTSDVVERPNGCIIYPYGNIDIAISEMKRILLNPIKRNHNQTSYIDNIINVYKKILRIIS